MAPRGVRADQIATIDRLIGPDQPRPPFGTYVVASTDPAAALGRELEREVFADVFNNSAELLAAEYEAYEASSVFIIVVDHRRRIAAGVMRLVLPAPVGLKSLEDAGRLWGRPADELVRSTGFDPDTSRIWDLATLAVGRDYRGAAAKGLISLALWQAVGVLADRSHVELLVAIIDLPVYRLLQLKLHHAFAPFDGLSPLPYLDSPASLPVWCPFGSWRDRIAGIDPAMHALMIGGTGLEKAIAPPDWDDAAATVRLTAAARR